MSDDQSLEELAAVANEVARAEEQKPASSTSVVDGVEVAVDVLDAAVGVGDAVWDGVADAGAAVAEHAGGVAETVVDVVGSVIGGLLDV